MRHLKCDSTEVCSLCSVYIWKPGLEVKYFNYCPTCRHDILCERGLIQEFIYDEEKQPIGVVKRCIVCRTEVKEVTWPNPKRGEHEEDDEPVKLDTI